MKLPNVPVSKLGGYYISINLSYSIKPIISKKPIAEAPAAGLALAIDIATLVVTSWAAVFTA